MIVLIDTNVMIDLLSKRPLFWQDTQKVMDICQKGFATGYITSNSVTDMIYILRKEISLGKMKDLLFELFNFIKIANVGEDEIKKAFSLGFTDYEDALQAQTAMSVNATHVITRNKKDFTKSSLEVITPKEFIEKMVAL